MAQAAVNPLLKSYKTPYQTIPFDKIENKHFEPAFEKAVKELEKDIDKIANQKAEPTFENTIVAMENSGSLLERVSGAFFNLLNSESDDEMMEISQRVSPMLTSSSNNIYLNK